MLKPVVLLTTVSIGAWLGWAFSASAGIMAAYLSSVVGASVGLFIGRRIQRNLLD